MLQGHLLGSSKNRTINHTFTSAPAGAIAIFMLRAYLRSSYGIYVETIGNT